MPKVLFSLLPLLISVIIFFDSKNRLTLPIRVLVSTLSTFLFPIVPLFYLGIRKKYPVIKPKSIICPKCGTLSTITQEKCNKCNNVLKL